MIHNKSKQHGFTIIELMIAMGGIAFLLLFIVFAILHLTSLYTKGLAIRQINQVGRQVTDDLTRAIRYGGAPQLPPGSNRLCVGGKSYVWNTRGSTTNVYTDDTPVGFVVSDSRGYCDNVGQKIDRASSRSLLGNIVTLQELTIIKLDQTSQIYEIKAVLSTAGQNQPTYDALTTSYECSPIDGQFCAFGEFQTNVYARE